MRRRGVVVWFVSAVASGVVLGTALGAGTAAILRFKLSYNHVQPGTSYVCASIEASSGAFLELTVEGPGGLRLSGTLQLKKKEHATAPGTFSFGINQFGTYRVTIKATAGGESVTRTQTIQVTEAQGDSRCSATGAPPYSATSPKPKPSGGGTLRVDWPAPEAPTTIDPALTRTAGDRTSQYATGAKLFNYPDREGAAGLRLIPEVATALPAISRDGKTYTFNMRRSYRFSNGTPVTARNFKLAFERGANEALDSPAAAYLRGVSVEATSKYQLRFTLSAATPDFLSRVALPYFSAVPSSTPLSREVTRGPFHTAGAYYATWEPRRQLVLRRNRFYLGPRPSNPDQIVENIGISLDAQMLRCERGQSDICGFPPAAAAELRDKYGVNRGRFFVKGQAVFWYLNFNHDEPLFKGNDKLKRAVNHALDRPQMVRQHGALGGARTDQILPIDFPGFRNWNLYSLRGANVTKAKELAEGNTRGGTVRLWVCNQSPCPEVGQVVKENLAEIGLNVVVTPLDRVVMTTRGGVKGADYDMLLNGWGEDYPDPYDFINILLDGTNIEQKNNVNLSYFNEPKWNARMDQASKQFGAQRLRTYAVLDRDLMRGPAPVAPYINTNARILVSDRVRNHIFHKVYGTDFVAITVQ